MSIALQPALQTLMRGVGGTGLLLVVTLRRIVEAGGLPVTADPAAGLRVDPSRGARPGGSVLELRGVTFAYGPQADPVTMTIW